MSSTTTTRLGLVKPTPGTGELVNVATQINASYDKIDSSVGFVQCTSTTRPTSPWAGMSIYETDTHKAYVHNGTVPASGGWIQLSLSGANFSTSADISANNLTLAGSASIAGLAISALPRGVVAWGERTTASASTAVADTGILRIDGVSLTANRAYMIWTSPIHLMPISNTANQEIRARLRYSTSGTATTSSGVLPAATVHVRPGDGNVSEDKLIKTLYIPNTNQTLSILLCIGRIAGTVNVQFGNSDTDGDDALKLVVEDVGAAVSATGTAL